MKTQQELAEILGFVAEYAAYQLGSGVHTSRSIRNSRRIGEALGVDVQLSSFQKSTILTVLDPESGEAVTRVAEIPALPISFERNSDLSALGWDALDEGLSLDEIRRRYRALVEKPRMDPIFTLLVVGLANASFCRLFGGDWTAVGVVFTARLRREAADAGPRREPFPYFHMCGLRRLALRLGGPVFRLRGRGRAGHESAVSGSGRAAHQRGHRHRGGARADRRQPSGQCDAAHRLHRRGTFGHAADDQGFVAMIFTDILFDALLAAVAAIGFGAISDPPLRAFPRIALLAAVGHALRFALMRHAGLDIASASFVAAFAIGMGSLWLGRGVRCPMTVLYIPALLPMVPGIYAYKTVFSLIMFLQSLDRADEGVRYMQQFFLNATVSLSVIALLAVGATLPIFVFKRRAFSMTRRKRSNN